jgi:hypothetical protein
MFQVLYRQKRDEKQQVREKMQGTDSKEKEKTGPWIWGRGCNIDEWHDLAPTTYSVPFAYAIAIHGTFLPTNF